MFVSQPFYHAQREAAFQSNSSRPSPLQQGDDFVVMMVVRQLSDASDEWLRDNGSPRRGSAVNGARRVSVSPPCQRTCSLSDLRLRPLRHGDVAHQQAQDALAIARAVVEAAHSRGKSPASCRICRFCSAVTARMVCRLEGGQLGLRDSCRRRMASFQRCSRVRRSDGCWDRPLRSAVRPRSAS